MKKYKILHVGLCVQPEPINAMQQAFIDNSFDYREISTGDPRVNVKAIEIVKDFRPDFVFFQIQAEGIIHPETVSQIKSYGAKVYNWTGDVRHPLPYWFNKFGADITMFSNMKDVVEMRSKGFNAQFLEIGFDENIYNATGESKAVEPIVFFGNNYGEKMFPLSKYRAEMVDYLKLNYGNAFGVYGTGWKHANGNFNHSQKEEAAAYRGSKIAINCSHFEINKYSSDRLLRILGTGTPICLAKHYPSIEEDFIDGFHLRVWKTIPELKGLIDYYSKTENEVERREIALGGMLLAREKFTFDCMVKNIIKIHEKFI